MSYLSIVVTQFEYRFRFVFEIMKDILYLNISVNIKFVAHQLSKGCARFWILLLVVVVELVFGFVVL